MFPLFSLTPRARALSLAVSCWFALFPCSRAAIVTWDGGGGGTNWTLANNWVNDQQPPNDGTADIVFAGTNGLTSDANNQWSIRSLSFANDAGVFSIIGQTLTIGLGGVINNDNDEQDLTNNLVLPVSQTWRTVAGSGNLDVNGNISLNGAATLTADSQGGSIRLLGAITGIGGFVKNGPGTVQMGGSGAAPNTYTGVTTVNEETLLLGGSPNSPVKVPETLIIGGGATSARVRVGSNEQIHNSIDVEVNTNGELVMEANVSQTIDTLELNGGTVTISTGATFSVDTVHPMGGTIGGSGVFVVDGPFITIPAATSTVISSGLDVNGFGFFAVQDGAAPVDLEVSGVISNGMLNKDGPGLMRLSGTLPNIYTDPTMVSGPLELAKSDGVNAIAGPLVIGISATVRLRASNQIADASAVTVRDTLDLNGFSETLSGPFVLDGGTVTTGAGTLTLVGTLQANVRGAFVPTISGNIDLDAGSQRVWTVNDGAPPVDFLLDAVVLEGGIIKRGTGTIRFARNSPGFGGATIEGGTLLAGADLRGSGLATIADNGGTLGGIGAVGPVIVRTGGTLSPGEGPGTFTTGDLTLLPGAFVRFQLGGAVNDLLMVGGNLTLDGTLVIEEQSGFGNGSYRLFNYSGTLGNNGLDLEAGFLLAHPGSRIEAATPAEVNLVVVPEPSVAALLAFLGGAATIFVRGRRRYRRVRVTESA